MNLKPFAKYLSIIFGPVWLPVIVALLLLRSNLATNQILILFPAMLIFQFVVPFVYIYIALKLGIVSAWDLPKRQERYILLIVYFVSSLISLALVKIIGNEFLFNLNLIFLALTVSISLITIFWKISIHTSVNTAGAILLNFLFGWQLPWLYLIIPIVFWSRYKLKRHTFMQLLAGITLSATVVLGGLFYFGYL